MSPSVRRPSSVSAQGELPWYGVQVQCGREDAVRQSVERRVRLEGLEAAVGRIVSPEETVAELRSGRRVERTRKLFPGYLICEVALDDRLVALFRETPGVIDFVRSGSGPTPLHPTEVARMLGWERELREKVVLPKFAHGDRVRILRGTFADMEGDVTEALTDTDRVRVRLTILGRPVFVVAATSEVLPLAERG